MSRCRPFPPRPALAERGQERAVRREFLNSVVVEVRDEHAAGRPDGDAGHGGEPAVKRPVDVHREGTAPFAQEAPVGRERLHPIGVAVGDEQRAVRRQRHVGGIREFAWPDARPAGLPP
jgi:hypothetical protein